MEWLNSEDEVLVKNYTDYYCKEPRKILQVFEDFFGEENVDLQGLLPINEFKESFIVDGTPIPITKESIIAKIFPQISILVHFPKVTITNDNDKSVDITHLYAKIPITCEGTVSSTFVLSRSEFPLSHINNNYLHSHVSSIFNVDDIRNFKIPCLGSGPIKNTILLLNESNSIELWELFCLELSKYVTVESLKGRPYKYLEHIYSINNYINFNPTLEYESTVTTYVDTINPFYKEIFKDFIVYLLECDILKYNFCENGYGIALSNKDLHLTISNAFIKWFNNIGFRKYPTVSYEDFLNAQLVYKCIIEKNDIKIKSSDINYVNWLNNNNAPLFKFKDEVVHLNIIDDRDRENQNYVILLSHYIVNYIIYLILVNLNIKYVYEHANNKDTGTASDAS